MQRFIKMVKACVESGVTDLHLTGNHPVIFRKNGLCYPQKSIIYSGQEVDALANSLLEDRHRRILRERWSVDFGMAVAGVNLRCNSVNTCRGLSFTFRFLPGQPPTVDNLNLHPTIHDICAQKSGLVLFCGATGSGKTSTIAAMINEINRSREAHIVTLEDPIEYRFKSIKSFVEQREMGVHFQTFEQGLYDVLRQMPDVIMIGELREREIIRQTLNIAESGHLVFGTLHASSPEEAIYRVCNAFPMDAQELIRFQLASTLQAVIVQQLHMDQKRGYRIPQLAILRNSVAVKNTLRENKLGQIESIIEMGHQEDMFTFKRYKNEFLDRKDQFVPPAVSFQAGKLTKAEDFYRSGMINFDVMAPEVHRAAPAPALAPAMAAAPGMADGRPVSRRPRPAGAAVQGLGGLDGQEDEGLYHIEEDASYEELISQMKHG